VNADLIAAQISPRAPETVAIAAGRQMLEEIRTLSERGEDFGFEKRRWLAVHIPV
jgi:predicted ABC-type ATPase